MTENFIGLYLSNHGKFYVKNLNRILKEIKETPELFTPVLNEVAISQYSEKIADLLRRIVF